MPFKTIRGAVASDANVAVPLLFDAAKHLLSEVFGLGCPKKARAYLRDAWHKGVGQYGFANHSVLEIDGSVKGLISSWHDQLPEDFDRCTLNSIIDFHGIDEALQVVLRSQHFLAVIDPPTRSEMAIGHVSVVEDARRQGAGRALVEHRALQAKKLNKRALVLNCENNNTKALGFYKALGFVATRSNESFTHMVKTLSNTNP